MKKAKREALFALAGATTVRPDLAYGIEVNAGGKQWRLVADEPFFPTRRRALDRVVELNTRVELLAEGIVALAGLGLADLAHSYRVVEVGLSFTNNEVTPESDLALTRAQEFDDEYGPTLAQIQEALATLPSRFGRVRVMSAPLGLIIVPLFGADWNEDRQAAQDALDALLAAGYVGTVGGVSRAHLGKSDVYEVRLVGPFPLIPGS